MATSVFIDAILHDDTGAGEPFEIAASADAGLGGWRLLRPSSVRR